MSGAERSKTIGVAVKGLVVYRGRALLIKRSDYDPFGAGEYECPGGRLEFGEALEAALEREIMEETGLKVSVERILYADSFLKHAGRQVVVLTWLCRAHGDEVTLSKEHTEFLWANKEEMRALLTPAVNRSFERCGAYEMGELE